MTRREAPVSPPVVLTIAGSDSGGGAGIQADLKTIEACGGFGTSAITSVTAQNSRGVEGSHRLPIADIEAQIEAVLSDFDVAAVKTGMLATSDVIDLVADHAPDLPTLVVDPVMVAASGDRLLEPDAEDAYADLLAHATLVTPNADEAEVLTGVAVEDEASATEAGRVIVEGHGANATLVKGGHVPGEVVADVLVTADGATTITHERVDTDATHGSGCTLSSAIATELACGAALPGAVAAGVDLLASAVRYNVDVGEGPGSAHHLVALRDDAALGETIDALEEATDRLADLDDSALIPPSGGTIVGATPYAETPADTVAIAGVGRDECDGTGTDPPAWAVRVGTDGLPARALLAAREADPGLRFCLAGRYDEAVAAALDILRDGPTVDAGGAAVDGTDSVPERAAIADQLDRAFAAAPETPVAVGLPDAAEATTLVFGATVPDLLDGVCTLLEGIDEHA